MDLWRLSANKVIPAGRHLDTSVGRAAHDAPACLAVANPSLSNMAARHCRPDLTVPPWRDGRQPMEMQPAAARSQDTALCVGGEWMETCQSVIFLAGPRVAA